jgi:ABC-type sugar transport system permease subunit
MIEWNGYIPIGQATFVGLKNFASFLTSGGLYTKEFLNSLYVTLILMLYIPFNIVISFLLAFVLNRKGTYMKKSLRLIYFLPFVSSAVAITLVFKNLFDINGVINAFFAVFGFGDVDASFSRSFPYRYNYNVDMAQYRIYNAYVSGRTTVDSQRAL